MESLNFAQVEQGPIYDPAIALDFFKSGGKVENVAAGGTLFVEKQKSNRFLLKSDRMYLLLEGEVDLEAGGKPIARVAQGEIFGEMASLAQLPRSATARARTACRVISLDEKQFQKALEQKPEFALMLMSSMIQRLRESIAAVLARSPRTEDGGRRISVFDRKLLAELVQEFEHQPPAYHPRHKVIMNEGEAGVFMYIVLEGEVAISIKDAVVERVGPGGVFGELALVDQSRRMASATAEQDCSLLAISRKDFMALISEKPAFGLSLLKALAERQGYMTAQLSVA